MMNWIAAGGMRDWTVGEWGIFFGVLTTFITATVTPAVMLVLSKVRETKTLATSAKQESSANTDRIVNLAQNMPSPNQSPPASSLAPLLVATPEAISKAFAASTADSPPSGK